MSASSSPPAPPPTTVKVNILVISDTHSALSNPLPLPSPLANQSGRSSHDENTITTIKNSNLYWNHQPLPKADILLHCGDLTSNGSVAQHERALQLLNSIDAELKIVIPGNHDLTLDRQYYDRYPNVHCPWPKYDEQTLDMIREMYEGEDARRSGIRYMVEGLETFTLPSSGATFTIYASAYTPEFWNWGFAYLRTEDRFNNPTPSVPLLSSSISPPLKTLVPEYSAQQTTVTATATATDGDSANVTACDPASSGTSAKHQPISTVPSFRNQSEGAGKMGNVDIMLTHGPPRGILDRTIHGEEVGCEHLMKAVGRCRPRVHAFGHIHEGWGAVWGHWDAGDDDGVSDNQPISGIDCSGLLRKELICDLESRPTVKDGSEDGRQEIKVVAIPSDFVAGTETLFVNASIMDVKYRPVQAPWLVQMDLPCSR